MADGGLLGPIGNLLGSVANAGMQYIGYQQQGSARDHSEAFMKGMSDTAHQREVADMKLAGLNPILSAGAGASTPSSSQPAIQAPSIAMPDMMAYGVSLKQLDQAQQKIKIDRDMADSAIAKNLTEKDLNKMKTIAEERGMDIGWRKKTGDLLDGFVKELTNSVRKPPGTPKPPFSSGGELVDPKTKEQVYEHMGQPVMPLTP